MAENGRFAYATNNLDSTVTGYRVSRNGGLRLLDADGVTAATGLHPVDLALTPNGRFLYTLNAGAGTVSSFAINRFDGSLIALGEIGGLPTEEEGGGAVGIAVR